VVEVKSIIRCVGGKRGERMSERGREWLCGLQ